MWSNISSCDRSSHEAIESFEDDIKGNKQVAMILKTTYWKKFIWERVSCYDITVPRIHYPFEAYGRLFLGINM